MIISKYNSFDYRKDFSVPFEGVYELVESYIGIYIFVSTDTDDIINVYYDNINNLSSPDYLITEQYTVSNEQKTILLSPKLKYFKLSITTTGDSTATRVVNTFYLDEQTLSSGDSSLIYGEDTSGNQHVILTDASGKLIVNTTITDITLDNSTSDILVYGNDGTTNRKILTDASGKLLVTANVYDGLGNPSNLFTDEGLLTTVLFGYVDGTTTKNAIRINNDGYLYNNIYGIDNTQTEHQILTDASGRLTLDNSTSDILVYGNDGTTNRKILTDNSGKIIISDTNPITTTTSFSATNTDAFGRLRISNPFTIFDAKNVNVKNPRFTEYTSGSGVITYDVSASLVELKCNSSAGMVVRESKNCFSYQPGKSLLILNTFVMNAAVSNVSQKVGYFDSNNGIYLDLNGNTLYISKRSMSTGTVVTTSVAQSSWNVNTLSSLDITKAQIFWMDIEWLGVGSVRTGFVIDGEFIVCHIFSHANIVTLPYMTTAQLPIRYEINSTSASPVTLRQICSTVISEGGYEGTSIIRHVGSGVDKFTLNLTGVRTPLIALRLNANKLNSIILPSQLSVALSSPNDSAYYEILLNPTIATKGGGAIVWNTYTDGDGTVSAVEYALDHSISGQNLDTITGGTIINSGYLLSHSVINLASVKDFNLQLGRTFNGSSSAYVSDILVLSLSRLTASTDCYGVIGWFEL